MSPEEANVEALHRIRQAEDTGTTYLDLSDLHCLSQFPRELERLTSLRELNLAGCRQLSGDLSPLVGLISLQTLDFSGCGQLKEVASLPGLESLQTLNLSGCEQLVDLSGMRGLRSLQTLDLSRCGQLTDLGPLDGLGSLRRLDLSGCGQLKEVALLPGLESLQTLNLSGCHQLVDVSGMRGLRSLQMLNLSRCGQLTDLGPLNWLGSLRTLDLSGCGQLKEVAPLSELKILETLDLSGCQQLRRFAPLQSLLPTLKELRLFGCKFDDLPSEVCGEEPRQDVLDRVHAHYGLRPDAPSKIITTEPPKVFVSYAWGDISPNASEEDRQRQEVVERLCQILESERWQVVRGKTALSYGDLISTFMKTLGQANLVIVVLSAKYLRSPFCMKELHALYQNSRQKKRAFLDRIIPMALADARIGTPEERVEYSKHWETRYLKLKANLDYLSGEDFQLYQDMKDWYNHIGHILTHVNDVLHPHGFDEMLKDDFAALRQMLQRARAERHECF